ncbi:zinc finger RNA-binding protein isoform X1 [Dendroctonus ponderosae]|uniref:DZF domain-containing protein n=2 Tax=Dendroctonus ponderosae TaxID=77166 RepID=A0AAR5Q6H1_DENPD|nr:zinc finger RNA-binding protein isoform X1 [Dendroctonus ponderosae]
MATNNYFGFTHGGTQYSIPFSSATTGAAYQAGQPYAVAASPASAAAATYGTQRAAGYDAAYQAGAPGQVFQGTYAAVGTGGTPAYEYGYGQTAAATYTPGYDQSGAGKPATYATTYASQRASQQAQATAAAKPAQYAAAYQPNASAYQATYGQPTAQTTIAAQPTTQAKPNSGTYSGYDAALYSAATMYVAQQQQGGVAQNVAAASQVAGVAAAQKSANWQGFKRGGAGGNKGQRPKAPPKPQQLHYCDVCKISCAGPQTYREHLEGQKHKKREAATKMAASVATTNANRSGNSLRCQLCDVTCTGNDAYAAHIRGAKHQKVVLLHTKLGKPIPPQEPEVIGGVKKSIASAPKINFVQSGGLGMTGPSQGSNGEMKDEEPEDTPEPDIQPVGQDYIEEIKSEDGKVMSFNCKLCECRFNDPNAKEMHMKGRRHRLQYKKKVNPDLVVDVKPSLRQKKIQEEKMRRAAMREEFWARRHGFNMDDEESIYWEDRRRYEEYMDMVSRSGGPFPPRGRPFPGGPPFFPGPGTRRPESSDDRHVMAKHAEIYPKEEELQVVQRIVSHSERALKQVSDQLAEAKPSEGDANKDKAVDQPQKEDGRDNQLFSFQKEQDASRMLRGVMRVGHLAKGLLLKGDNQVELVVLCADKPTLTLLKKVVELLPAAFKQVAPDAAYQVVINPAEAGLTIQAEGLTVLVQLTSPVMREQEAASGGSDRDVLSRGKCLQALAALRHTKWFQARALGLHSCVIIIRILRDLCQRVPTWSPLSSWAMELLAEKVLSSTPGQVQLSPGDALRRVMEAVAGGLLLPGGPGLADPCEKDGPDASGALSAQQREDLSCSAQYALRLIAFRQIFKVLGMDALPLPQKSFKKDRSARKRRRSGGEPEGSESDTGKIIKTESAATPTDGTPAK